MVNEFYAALLNTVAINSAPGGDFVPAEWRPRLETSATTAVRDALLLDANSPVAANWRSIEIRKVIEHSDLATFLSRFDRRSGFTGDEMQADLVRYLRPGVIAETAHSSVRIVGKLRSNAFTIRTWQIVIVGGGFTLTTDRSVVSSSVGDGAVLEIPLPGTEARVVIAPVTDNNITVTWGAPPSVSLADTAKLLRTGLGGTVRMLAEEESTLDGHDRKLLRDIVIYDGEAAAQVGAAAILLAGATLAKPMVPSLISSVA